MPETIETRNETFEPAQAAELAVLVDLEARWENLRNSPVRTADVRSTTLDLHGMQRAYETFRAKLETYNKRYAPAHVPELLLNNSIRLGRWCRKMLALYTFVEGAGDGHCPVDLMEKAYRWADRVAARMGKAPFTRSSPPADIRCAIRDLGALARWCDELATPAHA
jgi:hypothetical protein